MNTRLLFGLLWLTPTLCFGALSTTTSYFLNVEALTNVTARSAVSGLTGVFTNSITLNGDTRTAWPAGATAGTVISTGAPGAVGDLFQASDTTGTNGIWSPRIWTNDTYYAANDAITPVALGVNSFSILTNSTLFRAAANLYYFGLGDIFNVTADTSFPEAVASSIGLFLSAQTNTYDHAAVMQLASSAHSHASNTVYGTPSQGNYGLLSYMSGIGGSRINGDSAALVGHANNSASLSIGVLGIGRAGTDITNTLVGVMGTGDFSGNSSVGMMSIGGYFQSGEAGNFYPSPEPAVLLIDNLDSGYPLIVGRTNNGTTVFKVDGVGAVTSSSSIKAASMVATNGITAGASTFTGNLTLGDSSASTYTLSSALSGATDPVLTFQNAAISSSHQIYGPAGSTAAPGLSFTTQTNTGWLQSSGFLRGSVEGVEAVRMTSSSVASAGVLQGTDIRLHETAFSGSTRVRITTDGADNVMQLGLDSATATAQTIKGPDGSGTDKIGGAMVITGGASTGTAGGGSLVGRTSLTGSASASSLNAMQDRYRYPAKYITLTDNTIASLFTVTLPATNSVGIAWTCTISAGDATDFQSLTTSGTIDGVAKTTTITTVGTPTAAQTALAGSAGTLSVTYTFVDLGSNVMALRVTADTSLTPTYLRAKFEMTGINIHGAGVVINEL